MAAVTTGTTTTGTTAAIGTETFDALEARTFA